MDGTSRRDVIQGILGDCWLLSTCAAVAKREDLMHRVLDPKQVKDQMTMAIILLSLNVIFDFSQNLNVQTIALNCRFFMVKDTKDTFRSIYGDMEDGNLF